MEIDEQAYGSPISILVHFRLVEVQPGQGYANIATKLNALLFAYQRGKTKRAEYQAMLAAQNRQSNGLRQFSLGIISEQISREQTLRAMEKIIQTIGENPFETVFKLYNNERHRAGSMIYNPETRWNLDVIELVARCPEEIRYACDVPVPSTSEASVTSGINTNVVYYFKTGRLTCPYCGRLTIYNQKYCTFCFLMIDLKYKEELIRMLDLVKKTQRYRNAAGPMTAEEFSIAITRGTTLDMCKESVNPLAYKKLPSLFWDPRYAITMCYRVLGLAHAVGKKDELAITLLLLSVYEQRLSLFTSYLLPWFLCYPMTVQDGVVSFVGPADMEVVMAKFLSLTEMLEKYDARDLVYQPKDILEEADLSEAMDVGYDSTLEFKSTPFIQFIKNEGLTLPLIVQFLAIINGQLNALLINDAHENGVDVGFFASMETAILTNSNMKTILKQSISKRATGYSPVLVKENIPITMKLGSFLQVNNPVLMDVFLASARVRQYSTQTITFGSIEVLTITAPFGIFSLQTSVGTSHMLFTPNGLVALETEGDYKISPGYQVVRIASTNSNYNIGWCDTDTRILQIGMADTQKFVFIYARSTVCHENSTRTFVQSGCELIANIEQRKHKTVQKNILIALYTLTVPVWQIWIRSHLGRTVPIFTSELVEDKLLMYLKWLQDMWKSPEYGFVGVVRGIADSFNITHNAPALADYAAASVSDVFWYFFTTLVSGIQYFIGILADKIKDISDEFEPFAGRIGLPTQLACNTNILEASFGPWENHEFERPEGVLESLSSIATYTS